MSHYTKVRTHLSDGRVLVRALESLGFKRVENHAEPQPLVGYAGDTRLDKAEIIIRRSEVGRLSNDIGFARQPDGTFGAIISDFDRNKFNAQWLGRVERAYALAGVHQFAADNDFAIMSTEEERDGTTRLILRRGA